METLLKVVALLSSGLFAGAALYTFVSVCFFLAIVGAIGYAIIDSFIEQSGWYPRTREITVYFKDRGWVNGELQICYSARKRRRRMENCRPCPVPRIARSLML